MQLGIALLVCALLGACRSPGRITPQFTEGRGTGSYRHLARYAALVCADTYERTGRCIETVADIAALNVDLWRRPLPTEPVTYEFVETDWEFNCRTRSCTVTNRIAYGFDTTATFSDAAQFRARRAQDAREPATCGECPPDTVQR